MLGCRIQMNLKQNETHGCLSTHPLIVVVVWHAGDGTHYLVVDNLGPWWQLPYGHRPGIRTLTMAHSHFSATGYGFTNGDEWEASFRSWGRQFTSGTWSIVMRTLSAHQRGILPTVLWPTLGRTVAEVASMVALLEEVKRSSQSESGINQDWK